MNWAIILGLGACAAAAIGRLWRFRRDYFGRPKLQRFTSAYLGDLHGRKLSHYYVQARGANAAALEAGLFARPPMDPSGIPMVDYGPALGRQYNPCTVAEYGLENWERYLDDPRPAWRDRFLQQAGWLVAQADHGNWRYRFDWPRPSVRLRSGWISGISQGKAVSLLLRVWQETGDEAFAGAARAGLEVFGEDIGRGGLAAAVDGGTWFEEYPDPDCPSHVLNGHVWALFGLWDAVRALDCPRARQWFDAGVSALEANLPRFDTGYWVLYEMLPGAAPVNSSYMHFQIDQLRALAAITGRSALAATADRWEGYHRSCASFGWIVFSGFERRWRRLFPRHRQRRWPSNG
jgi:heparosan-N-sulfate-glucuronate 5-epimerase